MNKLDEDLVFGIEMDFLDGKSIRQVCEEYGIAKETAHRIQKKLRIVEIEVNGHTTVACGKKADGSLSYYTTREVREHWKEKPKRRKMKIEKGTATVLSVTHNGMAFVVYITFKECGLPSMAFSHGTGGGLVYFYLKSDGWFPVNPEGRDPKHISNALDALNREYPIEDNKRDEYHDCRKL